MKYSEMKKRPSWEDSSSKSLPKLVRDVNDIAQKYLWKKFGVLIHISMTLNIPTIITHI